MASFGKSGDGTYYQWIGDEGSIYTLGNKYVTLSNSSFSSSMRSVIPAYTQLSRVDVCLRWKTSIGSTKGDGYLYIGDTKVGGEWNTGKDWRDDWVENLQGYFQSGTANAGLPTSEIRGRFEASWGRTSYYVFKIRWYPKYTITVNNGTGGGTYNMGSTATIKATVPTGYEFVKWNDGNTNRERTVTVTGNATYTAELRPQKIEFSVQMDLFNSDYYTEDEKKYIMNYCKDIILSGSGTYDYGSTVKLKCENLPKKIDIKYWIAYENDSSYNIYLTEWTGEAPSFQIGETFLSSLPNNTVYKKIKIVLFIAPQACHITPEVSPYKDAGNITTVDSEGEETIFHQGAAFSFGRVYTFRIKENYSYKYNFIGWSDGTTNLDIKIRVIDDFTLTAYFEKRLYNIAVNVNPLNAAIIKMYLKDGTDVTGETKFEYGTFIKFTITPNEGYTISDTYTESTTIGKDKTFVFNFRKLKYTIKIKINPLESGEVIGEREYEYGDIVQLEAIPSLKYKFAFWVLEKNYYEPILTYEVKGITQDTEELIYAYFEKKTYHFSKTWEPLGGGNVRINGQLHIDSVDYGETVVFEAIPSEGYKFVKWNEDLYDNPLTVVANDEAVLHYVAYFEELKLKFKTVKIYYPSENDIASPTNPLISGEKAQIVVQVALE